MSHGGGHVIVFLAVTEANFFAFRYRLDSVHLQFLVIAAASGGGVGQARMVETRHDDEQSEIGVRVDVIFWPITEGEPVILKSLTLASKRSIVLAKAGELMLL